jgi:protein SDA1
MGINVIREIALKNSDILNEDLVQYISTYYEYKNRNVSTAAKGFINVVRDLSPELLERKYRGRNFI